MDVTDFELLDNSSTSASVRSLSTLSLLTFLSSVCMLCDSSVDRRWIESCLLTSASMSESLEFLSCICARSRLTSDSASARADRSFSKSSDATVRPSM